MKNKRKLIKKTLCIAFSAIMLLGFAACSSDKPAKESYSGEEATVKEEKTTFALNETAVFKNLKITATELKESDGESFFKPESGNVFVGVKFTIENISDEEQTVSSLLLFDAYADDVSYSYSITGTTAFGNETVDGTIAPGKKIVGWYGVEIPANWEELEINVKNDLLSDNPATFVFGK